MVAWNSGVAESSMRRKQTPHWPSGESGSLRWGNLITLMLPMICPIRKSGPKMVRRLCNLRPVSFGSDIAQVLNAVWVQRNQPAIDSFVGRGVKGLLVATAG